MIDFLEDRNQSGQKGQAGFLVASWMESDYRSIDRRQELLSLFGP